MSYKNILVHLNRASRGEALLEPALELAKRQQAHLIGLYVRPRIEAAKAVDSGGHSIVLDDEIEAERLNETTLRTTFARMIRGQPFTTDWQAIEAQADLAANVVEHARVADLVIANQSDPDWEQGPEVNFPERLILESGRPVLLVPYIGTYRDMGKTVVIAWKPGPEAARAVFNAMPILKSASRVHILQIAEGRREMPPPATGLVSAANCCRGSPISAPTCWSWARTVTRDCANTYSAAPRATSPAR